MWTGSEWIPAPPTSAQAADSTINFEQLDLDFGDDYVSPSNKNQAQSNINIQDSAMKGNVNIKQNSDQSSSTINLTDSAMSGDINIAHNDIDGIVLGVRIAEHEKWAEKLLTAPANPKPGWAEIARNFVAGQRNLIINPSSTDTAKLCVHRECGLPVESQKLIVPEYQQYEYMWHSRSQFYEMCDYHFFYQMHILVAWFETHEEGTNGNPDLHSLYQQLGDQNFFEYVSASLTRSRDAADLVNGK